MQLVRRMCERWTDGCCCCSWPFAAGSQVMIDPSIWSLNNSDTLWAGVCQAWTPDQTSVLLELPLHRESGPESDESHKPPRWCVCSSGSPSPKPETGPGLCFRSRADCSRCDPRRTAVHLGREDLNLRYVQMQSKSWCLKLWEAIVH